MPLVGMPSVAPGDTITSAGWNVITSNISLLDGRTGGGDPGSAGKLLVSTGILAAAWTAAVNFTQQPTFLGNVIWNEFNLPSATIARRNTANSFDVNPSFVGNPFWNSFNLPSASIARTDAPTNFTTRPTVSGNPVAYVDPSTDIMSITGLALTNLMTAIAVTLTGLCKARTFESTVATGTAPIVVASGTNVPNLNASFVGGVPVVGLAQLASASNFTTAPTISGNVVWTAGNDGPGSTLDADTVDGIQAAALLARANHTGTQLAATISDLATAVGGMAAFSAVNATNASNATTAATAANALLLNGHAEAALVVASAGTATTATNSTQLGGVAASGYARFVAGTFAGNNGASRQITTGFLAKYGVLSWVSGGLLKMAQIISATPSQNIVVFGTGPTYAVALLNGALHASDGFVVDPTDDTNTTGITYRYAFWG